MMESIQSDITAYDKNVRSVYVDIKEFIKTHEVPHVADWSKIQTRKGLYEAYGAVVELSNSIAVYSAKVIDFSILRVSFKRIIRGEKYPPALAAVLNKSIDEVNEMVEICDKMLQSYKTAVDNQMRFYGSVQYILSAPRLSTIE